jgi:hypothetical protein
MNNRLGALIAQSNLKVPETLREELYIGGAIIFVTVLAATWLLLSRKKHRRRYDHAHHHRAGNEAPGNPPGAKPALDNDRNVRKRRRGRRSKYPERPLNPTLAQTRGLPPLRNQSTPPAGT